MIKYNKNYHPHHIERLKALQGMPLAKFWQRGIAFLIDVIVSMFVLIIGLLLYGLITRKLTYIGGSFDGNLVFPPEVFGKIMEFLLPLTYFGLMVFLTQGKTVGKYIMGIRIVPVTHEKITLLHSAERAMAYVTSLLEFGFGFIQFFMNRNHRTLGDKVGETIVINDRKMKRDKKQLDLLDREEEVVSMPEAETKTSNY